MSLLAHQKVATELAGINTRVGDALAKLSKMVPHTSIQGAMESLERVRGAVAKAQEYLAGLPDTYSPHATKMTGVVDIREGCTVTIRDAHRKKYVGLLTWDDMNTLTVVSVGASCGVQTQDGVRLLVPRGHLVTSEAPRASG